MVQTTVRITESAYQQLKMIAKARGLTVNAVVNNALWEFVNKQEERDSFEPDRGEG